MKDKKNIIPHPPVQNKNFFNGLFPEEANEKNRLYLFSILVFYSFVAFIGISKHEMWRDEIEPWLVGSRSDSLSDFFHNMKMASNPYIWYLILHFLSKITLNPVIIQIAHISFAIGAVYLFLRFAPFSPIQKMLFCFGYYTMYEYGIISRGYSLTVFFLFLFCAFYKKYRNNNIPLAVVIFFLANAAGGFGAILSISLLVLLVANYYFNEMSDGKKKQTIRYVGWAVIIILFSVWASIKSISPPSDSVYATKWFTDFDLERFSKVISRIWAGFVPLPDFSSVQFWNTNFLLSGDIAGNARRLLAIFSITLIIYNVLYFSKNIGVVIFYFAGTCGVLLLSYLSGTIFFINASRYNGFLFLIYIVSHWLLMIFPERRNNIPILTMLREKLKINKYGNHLLYFFLGVNFLASAIAYYKDYRYTFSAAKDAGAYITKNNLTKYHMTGYIDYAVSPITAYTRKPFYYPERDTVSTFPIWTTINYTTDGNQVMNRMLAHISRRTDTTLVVLNFDLNTTMIGDINFQHLASFKESVVADENYSIYLASRFNLEEDLKNTSSPITDDRIRNYIAIAGNLLQQNNIDGCQKIVAKMGKDASEKKIPRYHNLLGMIFLKKNLLSEAKKEFQKEVDLNLQKDEAYFQLGLLYYQEHKSDSAIFAWEKTVSFNPNNVDAYSNLGVCYLNFRNDMNKAEEYWNKCVQLNPNYVQGYFNLMILCQNKKDDDCMLKYLRIVLQKGISVDEIKKKGIVVSDNLLKRVNS